MAYVALRRSIFLDKRLFKEANVCGCCSLLEHKFKHTSVNRKYNCYSSSHRRPRHRLLKPFPIIQQPSLFTVYPSSYVFKQGNPFIPHCDILSHNRSYHLTAYKLKDESIVEKSVKVLKKDKDIKEKTSTTVEEVTGEKPKVEPVTEIKPDVVVPEPSGLQKRIGKWKALLAKAREVGYLKYFWNAFKGFIKHYKDGFKLFWVDLKICLPLLLKYIRNGRSSLKRREYRQLTRTLGDLVRMVPLIPMLIIPFGELFIPLYISFGFMPSVFMNKTNVEDRNKKKLQKKLEYSALLTQSLQNVPLSKKRGDTDDSSTLKDFTEFLEKVKSTETLPNNEDILKFSRLFEDELTLEDLNVEQLQGLCKLLGIGFLGEIPSSRILRFQIGMKLRELEVDDKEIMKEGADSLTIWELQAANRARGMRAIGVPEDRLKLQLQQWLELHLKEHIPSTLLLLSRVMYLDENLSPAEQLKQTISALSDSTVDKVKVEAAQARGEDVDKETKIKVLSEETKAIKEEEKQEREELEKEMLAKQEAEKELLAKQEEAERLAAEVEKIKIQEAEGIISAMTDEKPEEKVIGEDVKPQPDVAEPIVAAIEEELGDILAKELEEGHDDITSKELGIIEQAIEDMAKHHQDEFEDVKEDLDDYIEDVEDVKALCLETSVRDQIQESKGAQVLRTKLDKYLSKMDKMVNKLHDERQQIKENMEYQEIQLKYEKEDKEKILDAISDKKRNLISINEVLLSLKRLQKVPDDVRMQKVLEVLDTDDDGLIDITDVLKVTEIMGRENLKLNKAEVSAMMNLLRKEELIEDQEKQQEKVEKELNKMETGDNNKKEKKMTS